jgi:asparagine synthetase B (glutamine-hydrolysing)
MASPDGKVLLTLNGEIYNAFEFKKELRNGALDSKAHLIPK